MDKILVTVHVPYIEEQYDFLVPINIKASVAFTLIQKSICDYNDNYVFKENVNAFDSYEGKLINQNNIVKFSGLKNGSHVMLI